MTGYCRWCSRPSADSDICDRCESEASEVEDRPRVNYPLSNVRIPYDPAVDAF